MRRILAIDPGNISSAYMILHDKKPVRFAKAFNTGLSAALRSMRKDADECVIEQVACYGMAVGQEVFDTVHWAGRLYQTAADAGFKMSQHKRQPVKLHLCNSPRAKDGNVRQAIIDRYGGKENAIGRKKTPGPLYGVSNDVWAALALGLYHLDMYKGC